MNALLLAALLMFPASSQGAVDAPHDLLAQKRTLPACAPPLQGDWWLTTSCLLTGDRTVVGNVYVVEGRSLHLAAGASLDLDLSSHHLWIGTGGRVLIGAGARIR